MLKKSILTAAFCIALLAPASAVATTPVFAQQETTVVKDGDQFDVPVTDAPDSREVNYVQESHLTRQMLKAKNAEENDSMGGAITIIAMSIVVGALIVLSLLFLIFGKLFSRAQSKKKKKAHGVDDHSAEDHHEEPDSGEVIAAIGMALAEHFGQGHDMEDTILTIKRMRKAYSPWNSKIYNLRQIPNNGAQLGVRRPLK